MTAKEKAKELIVKFSGFAYGGVNDNVFAAYKEVYSEDKKKFTDVLKFSKIYWAKQCALKAVDEILTSEQTAYTNQHIEVGQVFKEFWQQVEEEINKI